MVNEVKVKDFLKIITKLHTLNPEAVVRFCYDTDKGVRFNYIEDVDVNYRQHLEGNKLEVDTDTVILDFTGEQV